MFHKQGTVLETFKDKIFCLGLHNALLKSARWFGDNISSHKLGQFEVSRLVHDHSLSEPQKLQLLLH